MQEPHKWLAGIRGVAIAAAVVGIAIRPSMLAGGNAMLAMASSLSDPGATTATAQPTASLTANGASSLSVPSGTSIAYVWSSANGFEYSSSLAIRNSSGQSVSSDPCGNQATNAWSISGPNGTLPGTTASCQIGYTYTVTYYVTGQSGVMAAPSITISVVPSVITTTATPPGSFSSQTSTGGTAAVTQASVIGESVGNALNSAISQLTQQMLSGLTSGSSPAATSPTATETESSATTFPATIQVTVPTLRVRSAPNTSASLAGSEILSDGDTFTATGEVTGQSVGDDDQWLVSARGNYVWSGGTDDGASSEDVAREASSKIPPAPTGIFAPLNTSNGGSCQVAQVGSTIIYSDGSSNALGTSTADCAYNTYSCPAGTTSTVNLFTSLSGAVLGINSNYSITMNCGSDAAFCQEISNEGWVQQALETYNAVPGGPQGTAESSGSSIPAGTAQIVVIPLPGILVGSNYVPSPTPAQIASPGNHDLGLAQLGNDPSQWVNNAPKPPSANSCYIFLFEPEINYYANEGSSLGNIISHEMGHCFGIAHDTAGINLMNPGVPIQNGAPVIPPDMQQTLADLHAGIPIDLANYCASTPVKSQVPPVTYACSCQNAIPACFDSNAQSVPIATAGVTADDVCPPQENQASNLSASSTQPNTTSSENINYNIDCTCQGTTAVCTDESTGQSTQTPDSPSCSDQAEQSSTPSNTDVTCTCSDDGTANCTDSVTGASAPPPADFSCESESGGDGGNASKSGNGDECNPDNGEDCSTGP